MAIAALQAIIDRIDTWAPEQQERAAAALVEIEVGTDDGEWTIRDEDVAEIERRMADEDAPTMSLEEFRRFIDDLKK